MFPLCRRWQTLQGPHSTCLMTAETHLRQFRNRHSRWLRTLTLTSPRCSSMFYGHVESTIFLGNFLITAISFVIFGLCSLSGYVGVRLCLRFQLRLAVFLIMIRRVPFEFKRVNKVALFALHVCFFLTGFFGWLALSHLDT